MINLVPIAAFAAMIAATLLRGLSVWRGTGVNPWAFAEARGKQRLAGLVFTISIAVTGLAAGLVARGEGNASLATIGAILAVIGVALVIIAQVQMGPAWRVGLREGDAPLFVSHGLYRYSRNPIFLGMILLALGTALAAGRWWGWVALFAFALACYVQVMIEEDHLAANFGEAYAAFRRTVPRWIGLGGIGI